MQSGYTAEFLNASQLEEQITKIELSDKEIALAKSFQSLQDSQSFQQSLEDTFAKFKLKIIAALQLNSAHMGCKESLDAKLGVDFGGALDFKDFTSELVYVESTRCLPNPKNLSVEQVQQLIISDEFQLQALKNLKTSSTVLSLQRSCQTTWVVAIGSSEYCFNWTAEGDSNTGMNFSLADFSAANASAPVYLRWSGMIVKKLNNGSLKIYSLAYGRGPKIPFKFLAKGIIESQENAYAASLKNWLAK